MQGKLLTLSLHYFNTSSIMCCYNLFIGASYNKGTKSTKDNIKQSFFVLSSAMLLACGQETGSNT